MDIGAAAKLQMLGVLIEALGSPSAPQGSPRNPQAASPPTPPPLVAGETVSATVRAQAPGGALLLALKGQAVEAQLQGEDLPAAARQPGAVLDLKVEAAGPTPRLAFVGVASPAGESPPPTRAAAPSPALPRAAPPDAVARATAEAVLRQGPASPLYADLALVAARPDAPLPAPAAALARALLDARLDGERPIPVEALKAAIRQSATPAEALLARAEPPPLDARTLLAALRDLLREGPLRRAPDPADAPPPRRDGAPSASRPAQPLLDPEAEPALVAAVVAREADRAAERLKLHHLAALPEARAAPGEPPRPILSFELPIAFGAQTAMAGFRIERERHPARGGADAAPAESWGLRFAVDAEGLGHVDAHLRLRGDTIFVSLWAEEPATQAAFMAALPLLEAALAESALAVGELAVLAGRPAETRSASTGRILDRVS